jgi:hypothetical protein
MKICMLGNFRHVFCTESHHKWSWENLGHQVIALQEGEATTDAVWAACQDPDVKIFQWTHSHGFGFPGSIPVEDLIRRIKARGIKTFSYHLDIYFGLSALDRREQNLGQHPSFRLDYFFSTDGRPNLPWKAKGINHVYMPPGVVAYGCTKGQFNQSLATDIAFVGSRGYHPEYPFRQNLISQLERVYGRQFRVFSGYREASLNSLYASCKIIVGDHCFAGIPKYWSDRLPETCGRGGFLLYPKTEGMTIPTATYEAGNLVDLYNRIAYFLNHPQEREAIRDAAFEHVKKHDTYTNRLQEILQVMGF